MVGTLAAGSAFVFFALATGALAFRSFDLAAAGVVIGLLFLSVAVAAIAADRRPR
jgi:hypothetical protein